MRDSVLLLMIDLPVKTSSQRRCYTRFCKDIKNLGYCRLQKSVFYKHIENVSLTKYYLEQLKKLSPEEGQVNVIVMPTGYFENMVIIVGEETSSELKKTIFFI